MVLPSSSLLLLEQIGCSVGCLMERSKNPCDVSWERLTGGRSLKGRGYDASHVYTRQGGLVPNRSAIPP